MKAVVREVHADLWWFWCPGCRNTHQFCTSPGRWTFNGDTEKPTFQPSLLTYGVKNPDRDPETEDFRRGPDGKYLIGPDGRLLGAKDWRCHSFVTEGRIQFLGDCTHPLAGQTVDLEPHKERGE